MKTMKENKMQFNAILAHDLYYGIGKDGSLPWPHNKEDMKWFREWTTGHVVVMGSNTWKSIGNKPLKNRINVVLTKDRNSIVGDPDLILSGNPDEVVEILKEKYGNLKIWFIGGGEIYKQFLKYCDKIYVTKFNAVYGCDVFANLGETFSNFKLVSSDIKEELTFSIWKRDNHGK